MFQQCKVVPCAHALSLLVYNTSYHIFGSSVKAFNECRHSFAVVKSAQPVTIKAIYCLPVINI